MEKEEPKEKQTYPRAHKFARLIMKGRGGSVRFQKFRKSPHFVRSKRAMRPIKHEKKVMKESIQRQDTWDRYAILKAPCTSERFYKKMEKENTIIFYVDPRANKQEIKKAFKDSFGIAPEKVNTLNTILGRKKAFVKIPKGNEASEVANKLGLI
ncbi:MAG: 50S ribosomal protein L23 [archaeon]|nr:50S ribosomal protein L23 [archaeon]